MSRRLASVMVSVRNESDILARRVHVVAFVEDIGDIDMDVPLEPVVTLQDRINDLDFTLRKSKSLTKQA